MKQLSDNREYGEERPGDVYESPCAHECRLGCYSRCERLGACKLEVTPDRAARAISAYYDNRRTVLTRMYTSGNPQVTVRTLKGEGLPKNDPITIWATSIKERDCPDPTPFYEVRAENVQVDGPHRITIASLNARIEDYAAPRRKA